MTDRELLELAAKAAGIEVHESDDGTMQRRPVLAMTHYVQGQPYSETRWDPLRDHAQALRLAVKLKIQVTPGTYNKDEFTAFNPAGGEAHEFYSYQQQDDYAATRRAIVRAATELAKKEKSL